MKVIPCAMCDKPGVFAHGPCGAALCDEHAAAHTKSCRTKKYRYDGFACVKCELAVCDCCLDKHMATDKHKLFTGGEFV